MPLLRRLMTGLCLCLLSIRLNAAEPHELVYLTEDYPPSNYVENGQLKGIAVDLLKALWKKMGTPEQPIQVINWARGMNQVETEENTVLFAMTRNAERESKFQWVGPIYRGRYVVYAAAEKKLTLSAMSDLQRFRVAVLRQDVGEKLVTDAGVPDKQMEKVGHIQQAVQMLQSGRVDFICIYADTLTEYAQQQKITLQKFTPALIASENQMFYAFNKKTDPAVIKRFQTALNAIDKQRQTIVKQYGGTP